MEPRDSPRVEETLRERGDEANLDQQPDHRFERCEYCHRVVERTFAWLGRYRRLSRDYERLAATTEALVLIAMARLMLRRLARP